MCGTSLHECLHGKGLGSIGLRGDYLKQVCHFDDRRGVFSDHKALIAKQVCHFAKQLCRFSDRRVSFLKQQCHYAKQVCHFSNQRGVFSDRMGIWASAAGDR